MRMLLSPTASGMLARRGLPIAIVAPIGIAFLRLQGQRAGLYDTEMGAALASSAFVGVACAMLAWGSVAVRKRERALAVANVARSKTETALRVSEARVVATLESLSDGFVTLGATYRFQFVNREAERLLRRTRDELLGRSLWELFPGMLGSEVEAALRDVTRAGSTRSVEAHDPVLGRWFAYRIYPSGSSGVSMYFRDITDERLATERAYKGEQQARALLAVIPGGAAFVVDRELRYLLAGGEALGRAGFTPEDLIGKTISEVLPPELAREYEPFYRRGLAGESFGYDHHAHGRWFVTHGVPLRDETGDVYAVLAFSHDITERKEAETALAVADRRKDEFLAMLAHELRNPIAPIANALALLERGPGAADDFAKLRELMHRQVRHMVRIIDDLLDVSRITRGLLELRREPLDLASVIRDAAEACRPMMERRGHTFTVALPATTVPVDGDAIRLSQVVGNLLFNACKYTPAGGRVELTLERGTSTAEVRVRDSGIGIPSEMLTTIFELFTQVDRSVERAQEGLGIGLSLAKRLVEMHGGAIRAESEGAGRGTVVIVTLPRMADPPPDGIPVAAGSAQGGAAREVLVVDDNKDAADSLATLLRFDGHEVRVAYDGDVAIREVRARKPDVILLDLGLPKMSGYDVCRTLRCDDPDRAILVVALTGWGGSEDRARTHAAGFDAHLVKPVDLAALREVLERPLEPARDRPAPLPG
ncbi:MAG: PAS domain-containing protein [Deltaproteobacteria bacterium]|nr:PAS domain-containing protein [Deltaproteobacteria bacterium]